MTESPRPTREQVEAMLRRADRHDPGSDMAWFAAEVRALRAELAPYEVLAPQACAAGKHPEWLIDSEHVHACPWCQIDQLRAVESTAVALMEATKGDYLGDYTGAKEQALRDALAARTPQPAEPPTGTPDDPDRVPCSHCEDGHQDPRTVPWGVWVAPDRDSDGQPIYLRVERTQGSHVAQSDADWLWRLIRDYRAAPQPAVPDGEDRADEVLSWLHERTETTTGSDGVMFARSLAVLHDALAAVPDGEDVPARLEAAGVVLNELVPTSCVGGDIRTVAQTLTLASPEVRAAVAAALARPTGGTR